ncbi:hypothetical protein AWB66_05065 [Caballeronia telluris]|uniref:Integrase catalytic subunit n=1 Tax=Caballeronia telluris TaxID=326475 RepID=A0A158K270_9BURK|nr:hypothetical protein AWB66_05065 [Caballeronia telluris]
MKQRLRIYHSESQKVLMWERWRAGESLQHIAQLLIAIIHPWREYWRKLEGSSRDGDRSGRSHLPSAKKSQESRSRSFDPVDRTAPVASAFHNLP